jgi:hypothetical protein
VAATRISKELRTDAQRVDKAVKLIRPKKLDVTKCRIDVEDALSELESKRTQHHWRNLEKAKKGKIAATKLAAAIRRFETHLRSPDLPYILASGLPALPKGGLHRLKSPSSSSKGSSEARDYAQVMIPSLNWSAFAAYCDQVEIGPAKQVEAAARHQAAEKALELLWKYRPRGEPFSTAPRSDFCSLARLFYGDQNARLHFHCESALRKKRSTK